MVKIGELFTGMSLDEKVALLSCADSWHFAGNVARGLPPALIAEGTHGLSQRWSPAYRNARDGSSPATCLPAPSALANSWDRELLHKAGRLLSAECRAAGVGLAFVPPATIKRSPLCGHGQECYSEDPWLTGELSAAYIKGLQEGGVGAILKHFACDNQDYRRMGIDAIVDERSLREIHLAGYEKAVREGEPWAVSVAGNRINGWLCTENAWLLSEVLREDWEYEGVAMSDWGAGGLRVRSLVAGLDITLPNPGERSDFWVRVAVLGNEIPKPIFDRAMVRTLDALARTVDEKKPATPSEPGKHHAFARRAARESMVLLRNEGLLPLRKGAKLALIGELAAKPVYQAWDSARVDPARLETALSELPAFTGDFAYARGYDAASAEGEPGLVAEAVEAAASAEAVILFAGMPEDGSREGRDLPDIRLPANQVELIEAVCAANPRTVVVLSNAAALELPWLGKTAALLDAFLSGEAGAGAALDLIFGLHSPSGKLAESWPEALSDLPASASFPGGPGSAEYREGLYLGYRWFDSS
jgi:beta-glucosidase